MKQPCKYGDPGCPCQDGDTCHYEGVNPMMPPNKPWKYFPTPFEFREPKTESDAACIYDAKGSQVAYLFWPLHSAEETADAEQETYRLGRLMADAASRESLRVKELRAVEWLKSRGWSNQYLSKDGWKNKIHLADLLEKYAASYGAK